MFPKLFLETEATDIQIRGYPTGFLVLACPRISAPRLVVSFRPKSAINATNTVRSATCSLSCLCRPPITTQEIPPSSPMETEMEKAQRGVSKRGLGRSPETGNIEQGGDVHSDTLRVEPESNISATQMRSRGKLEENVFLLQCHGYTETRPLVWQRAVIACLFDPSDFFPMIFYYPNAGWVEG